MALGRSTKIISMIKWIRTSRLSIKNSLSPTYDRVRVSRPGTGIKGRISRPGTGMKTGYEHSTGGDSAGSHAIAVSEATTRQQFGVAIHRVIFTSKIG